jgi:hypothetical protein
MTPTMPILTMVGPEAYELIGSKRGGFAHKERREDSPAISNL